MANTLSRKKPDRLEARVEKAALHCVHGGPEVLNAVVLALLHQVTRQERARLRRVVRRWIREVERGSKCQENTSYKLALTDLLQAMQERP